MSVDLFLEDGMFISVKRASQKSGYSQDYIGQLSRKGKIPAKLIGRTWFVNINSLIDHKNSVDQRVSRSGGMDLVPPKNAENKGDLGEKSIDYSQGTDLSHGLGIPNLIKKDSRRNLDGFRPHRFLAGSAVLVTAFVLFGSAYSWANYLGPTFLSEVGLKVASYYDEVTKTISNTGSILSTFQFSQAGSFNGREASVDAGIVVLPESSDQQEKIDLVKENFSDEVEVYFDKDDQSGVIRPVFRSNEMGEDYAFVIVPIKAKK